MSRKQVMNRERIVEAAHPRALSSFLASRPMPAMHHGDGKVESVRQADHKGHHIVIRTTYVVEVDGRALDLPLGVDNDGHVHCHSLPNYQFSSAIAMVKQIIDTFPKDFPKPGKPPRTPPPPSPHDGMHMSMPMPGDAAKGKKK
jgi:hypothetical protein